MNWECFNFIFFDRINMGMLLMDKLYDNIRYFVLFKKMDF